MSTNMTSHKLFAPFLLGITFLSGCAASDPAPVEKAKAPEHDNRASEVHVPLTPPAAQAAGIEIATVGETPINEVLALYGTVQANSERVAEITARFPGVIRTVTARVGDAVRQGQIVATVESDESLQTYPVPATLSGVITMRKANPGEKAGEAPLFTVADLSTVWVELSMFPRDLAKVRVGQKVRVRSVDNALSSEGRIVTIAALGQSASQTLSARVLLDNKDRIWVPGLYVMGEVKISERRAALAVKSAALQLVKDRTVVFVVSGEGFEAAPVVPGLTDTDYTQIRSGLKAGDRYAAAGSFVLKSELGKGESDHED
jgi:cobalt-zinc-cadmium efflux system membrane fusion protein